MQEWHKKKRAKTHWKQKEKRMELKKSVLLKHVVNVVELITIKWGKSV